MSAWRFWVAGMPAPGGSKRAMKHKSTGKIIVLDDGKNNKQWRSLVADAARDLVPDLLRGPVMVRMTFVLPRPKGHFGTGRNAGEVKASAPIAPTGKPDVLKLGRSTEDALTGTIWHDDAATVCLVLVKIYGPKAGAMIEVETLDAMPMWNDLVGALGEVA